MMRLWFVKQEGERFVFYRCGDSGGCPVYKRDEVDDSIRYYWGFLKYFPMDEKVRNRLVQEFDKAFERRVCLRKVKKRKKFKRGVLK